MHIIIVFLSVVVISSIYLSMHIYYSFLPKSLVYSVLLVVLLNFLIMSTIFGLFKSYPNVQFCIYFLLGIYLYAVTFYLISDIFRIIFTINPFKEGLVVFSLAIIITTLGYINTRFIRETTYEISSTKVTRPIKVVLAADIHIGSPDVNLKKMNLLVTKINKQKPDIVVLAGDILDNASIDFEKTGHAAILKNITASHGVFAFIGNHETYRGNVNTVIKKFNNNSLQVINNNQIFIEFANLSLIGLSDKGRTGVPRIAVNSMNINQNNFNLVVEHNPKLFKLNAESKIDLQLSGHTHAGQIIHGYLMEKFIYDKSWGLLKEGESTLITTSGIGSWGPPIRDITYPEIVIINIIPKK